MKKTLTKKNLVMGAAVIALSGITAFAPVTAEAGGRHGRHYGGYHHHHRGGGGDAALAAGVGLLLGATLMAASQPSYYNAPPARAYAPPSDYYGQNSGYYGQGNAYYETPVEATPASDVYRSASGQYCREYQSRARINGRMQTTYGTACQDNNGEWRIVN